MAVICGARHRIKNVDTVLEVVASLGESRGKEIQILDATMIFGREHLEAAAEKTVRAFSEGRNISKTMATELLLYAGAERQISTAIRKMGIKEGLEEIAVVIFGDEDIDQIIDELGWVRDDSVLEPDLGNLEKFGIDSTDHDNVIDIVLEKMALSELER